MPQPSTRDRQTCRGVGRRYRGADGLLLLFLEEHTRRCASEEWRTPTRTVPPSRCRRPAYPHTSFSWRFTSTLLGHPRRSHRDPLTEIPPRPAFRVFSAFSRSRWPSAPLSGGAHPQPRLEKMENPALTNSVPASWRRHPPMRRFANAHMTEPLTPTVDAVQYKSSTTSPVSCGMPLWASLPSYSAYFCFPQLTRNQAALATRSRSSSSPRRAVRIRCADTTCRGFPARAHAGRPPLSSSAPQSHRPTPNLVLLHPPP